MIAFGVSGLSRLEVKKLLSKEKEWKSLLEQEAIEVSENELMSRIPEMSGATTLFGTTVLFSLEVNKEDTVPILMNYVQELSDSKNGILVLVKNAAHVKEFKKQKWFFEKKVIEERDFSTFTLSDAWFRRDRKTLWRAYRTLCEEGKDPQELGMNLLWACKQIELVRGVSQKESGMKPFSYTKASSGAKNYSHQEIVEYMSTILDHLTFGRYDDSTENRLEEFILSVK